MAPAPVSVRAAPSAFVGPRWRRDAVDGDDQPLSGARSPHHLARLVAKFPHRDPLHAADRSTWTTVSGVSPLIPVTNVPCSLRRPARRATRLSPAFVLGVLMFYVVLCQSRLVPRWLSTWGLVGAALGIMPPLGGMFGLSLGSLVAPLALQEMVMAVWLIAEDSNPTAIPAESAGETSRWQAATSGSAA
jgi:hypothetical protein